MATPNVLIGSKFRLYLSDGTINATRFDNGFVCLATDLGFTRSTEFEDVTVNDCDSPAAPAQQISTPRLLKTEVTFGGVVDAKKFQALEAAWETQAKKEWRLLYDETNVLGGERNDIFAYIEELKIEKQNAGAVKFTAKLKAQGVPTRTLVP
jgi:predicted secreted protein